MPTYEIMDPVKGHNVEVLDADAGRVLFEKCLAEGGAPAKVTKDSETGRDKATVDRGEFDPEADYLFTPQRFGG